MLFNSLEFLVLVVATCIAYYLPIFHKIQVVLLIAASFVFYGSHEPWLLLLLMFSVAINSVVSWKIGDTEKAITARCWAVFGVVVNLLVLGFFKYAGLFGDTLGASENLSDFLYRIPLPVGISFFTFQGLSLVVDVFNKEVDVSVSNADAELSVSKNSWWNHVRNTTFYIAFFPQLVAGPIVKANEFFPQISPKKLRAVDWAFCFKTLVIGYFLKMVVADNLKDQTFWIQYPYFLNRSAADLLVLLFGFSMQIFADFAGYSLIAIGVAGLFGYRLPQNFDFPYIASSFSEFWRRWHISLSTWLRDYLYFPMGGNRNGNFRTYINLFIVMFLGGMWHGAAWSYAIWGSVHGLALAAERLFRNPQKIDSTFSLWMKRLGVFLFVTFAWLLFKLPEFSHVIAFFETIGSNFTAPPTLTTVYYVAFFSTPVILYHISYFYDNTLIKSTVKPFAFGFMLFLLIFNSGSPGEFIYFQF